MNLEDFLKLKQQIEQNSDRTFKPISDPYRPDSYILGYKSRSAIHPFNNRANVEYAASVLNLVPKLILYIECLYEKMSFEELKAIKNSKMQ